MSAQWKPGDVVAVSGYDDPDEVLVGIVRRRNKSNGLLEVVHAEGFDILDDEDLKFRPLLVIDPEDREQTDRLLDAYWAQRDMHTGLTIKDRGPFLQEWYVDFQAALRSLLTPPRPEEPTGLGAVVEDGGGVTWTRVFEAGVSESFASDLWVSGHARSSWADIDAVKVLSEGVTS